MTKFTTKEDLGDLAEKLRDENDKCKCSNIRADDIGPYCGKGLNGTEQISEKRRWICDKITLKLYCLDDVRYRICIWNTGERLDS